MSMCLLRCAPNMPSNYLPERTINRCEEKF
jgi:hypothetical protein